MQPTWGPPGSCRPQVGPTLAPSTLLSRLTFTMGSRTVAHPTVYYTPIVHGLIPGPLIDSVTFRPRVYRGGGCTLSGLARGYGRGTLSCLARRVITMTFTMGSRTVAHPTVYYTPIVHGLIPGPLIDSVTFRPRGYRRGACTLSGLARGYGRSTVSCLARKGCGASSCWRSFLWDGDICAAVELFLSAVTESTFATYWIISPVVSLVD